MNQESVHCSSLWGGVWRDGAGASIDRRAPSDLRASVSTARQVSDEELDDAVATAVDAQRSWERAGAATRCAVLRRAAVLLEQRSEQLGAELAWEEGKVLGEAIGEVRRAAQIFSYFGQVAEQPTGEQYTTPHPGERVLVTRRAVGTVAVVTPWNFPIAIPAWKIAPALAYGNTVVWKPASYVPLLSYRLAQVLVEAGLPAGALSLVFGSGRSGQRMVLADGVDAVSFTGSTGVGRMLIAECGALARPIQAELGGKNAVIVADDADLDLAAAAILDGGFSGNGQKCTATSRVLVDQRVADRLITELRSRVADLVVGDPRSPQTHVGPVVSRADQVRLRESTDRVAELDGHEVIARAVVPGELVEQGCFVEPSIWELHEPAGEMWTEELFGPAISLIRTSGFEAALELANDSEFGLSGAVFTESLDRAEQALTDFQVGLLTVNGPTTGGYAHLPFGGLKGSSYGPREQGASARDFYTTTTTAYVRRSRGRS